LDDQEIKAEKAKFLMGRKSHCTLLLGILSLLLLPTLFYLHSLGGILKQYKRSEYLRIADFDLKVLETKRAIDSLKIREIDDELAYKYATLIAKYASLFELDPLDIVSVIYQESSFNPQAISPTGDYGLMGINWHYVGRHRVKDKRDLLTVETNLRIGVEMLNFWREFSRKNTRGEDFIPFFFNHYNQGVVPKNGDYAKKVSDVRKKLALHQMLVPNHLLAMENSERAIIGP
jgi:membrane-bound lytic murein transglycosylase MltF